MNARMVSGGDERRMQVRAYNGWSGLLLGRDCPLIDELDLDRLGDFAAHSVLLDLGLGLANPALTYVGTAIRSECGLAGGLPRFADLAPGSLLAQLAGHMETVVAMRAAAGFEAEMPRDGGGLLGCRGILLPYSSDGDSIDFIHAVISWKLLDAGEREREQSAPATRREPAPAPHIAAWADGPGSAGDWTERPEMPGLVAARTAPL